MSNYDRVIQTFPFRGSNTSWRRGMFVNHFPLAGTSAAFPGWSWFVPVRHARNQYKRTWVGATYGLGGDLFGTGGPVAEWRNYSADEPPERPCDNVTVYYSPDASEAWAIRRDTPPFPQVGYDAAGLPVNYTLDEGRTGMGGLNAERVVECTLCPPHPQDQDLDKPRQSWLRVLLSVNFDGGPSYTNRFDARPAGCGSLTACCEIPAAGPGGCLFIPQCAGGDKFDPFSGRCPVDAPSGGCTWSNNRFYQWEFCGWQGQIWWQGFLWCYPAQCQASLPTNEFVGAEMEISWSAWNAFDGSQWSSEGGTLGFDDLCNCSALHEHQYPSPAPECKFHEGHQWGYVYKGDEVCRPRAQGGSRHTKNDITECWGMNPETQINQCTNDVMSHYSVFWSCSPN